MQPNTANRRRRNRLGGIVEGIRAIPLTIVSSMAGSDWASLNSGAPPAGVRVPYRPETTPGHVLSRINSFPGVWDRIPGSRARNRVLPLIFLRIPLKSIEIHRNPTVELYIRKHRESRWKSPNVGVTNRLGVFSCDEFRARFIAFWLAYWYV